MKFFSDSIIFSGEFQNNLHYIRFQNNDKQLKTTLYISTLNFYQYRISD